MKGFFQKTTILLMLAVAVSGCAGGGNSGKGAERASGGRQFPAVKVPAAYADMQERLNYAATHFWDNYARDFRGIDGQTLESAVADFVSMLDRIGLENARKAVEGAFSRMETSDMDSAAFWTWANLVGKYLYDPNSPLRDEDCYQPFVKRLSVSARTPENLRASYAYSARMCSLNCRGEIAPDFTVCDARGRCFSLHGIKAEYTLLFFSNPGCEACREIRESICSRPYINGFIADGTLCVLNVYIDEDIDSWRAYAAYYPDNWLSGYDETGTIRADCLYNVRAIPSLYLLDSGKRIIMKDAPTEKALEFLDRLAYEGSEIQTGQQ